MPSVQESSSSSSLHRYIIFKCAQVKVTLFKTQTQCMNGHCWFLCAEDRGEEWFSHTIPFCFHRPRMKPCYPNTDSNMTCHSEREQCHRGLLQACPLCNFGREHNSTMAALRLRALGSMHPGCKPSAPTLAHPQNPSSTRKHPQSLLYHFCIVYLLVVDSHSRCCHSCIFFPFSSAPMTSVFPCTIPQTRPTKLALKKE